MKIGIVGAGVLGSIFGSLFSQKGFAVSLIEVLVERVRLIEREGLWVQMPDGSRVHTAVRITSAPATVGLCDVVMVCVKGYHTASAIRDAQPLIGADTLVLSVQNGLGNLETLAEAVGPERVIGGITAHSGMPVSMNEVRYVGGLGPLLVIGPLDAVRRPAFERLLTALTGSGLDVHAVDDINQVIWKKLIANVATNCVAALTGLTGGQAVQHGATVQLIRGLAAELGAVARAKGIDVSELDDPGAFAVQAFASTRDNKVSMLQDVEAGRPTEIGTLNEVIVREGQRLGIATPFNEAVSLLVRGVEERNRLRLRDLESLGGR
ncbi:MAG: 2-dehydropantoate 2-reductase [Deltaproteobacteria bacterium]|nr:2-dehydropantoate 2-reductase [Deltaproteobacteria bacterium]